MERFRELIEANLIDSELSVEELGSKMGLSRVLVIYVNGIGKILVC